MTMPLQDRLLDAALSHVAFDGWSFATLKAAAADCGIALSDARAVFPQPGRDLALAYHRRGDALLAQNLKDTPVEAGRMRDKIANAIKMRLRLIDDREAVRRGVTLFALPQNAAIGTRAMWETADTIWTGLGDRSQDGNWYSKRLTLSAVYSATLLFWLGDESADYAQTWAFLDRRIDDVMQIEKVKAKVGDNPVLSKLFAPATWASSKIRPPMRVPKMDFPGYWAPRDDSAQ